MMLRLYVHIHTYLKALKYLCIKDGMPRICFKILQEAGRGRHEIGHELVIVE